MTDYSVSDFYYPATLTTGNGLATVTAFNADSESPIYTANESHPHWEDILEGLSNGDPNVWELFDLADAVMRSFREVTDRVSYDGANVLFDGNPIHSVLTKQLARAIEDGDKENFTALAKFWEKLETNPNEHSRQQAYDFLASHQFQITADGDVVGFKGVHKDANGNLVSAFASRVAGKPSAYVDGKPVPPQTHVPNAIGTVVTMPRNEVVHDPFQACSRGLHVSTRSYAESYASGALLEVHVNPRDIVSVPNDASGEKVRVCRYKVVALAAEDYGSRPVLAESRTANAYVGYSGI